MATAVGVATVAAIGAPVILGALTGTADMAALAVTDIVRAGAARASPSKVSSDGDAIPGPALPITSGRSNATAAVRAGDSPVSAPGSPDRRGRVGAPATASRSRMSARSASSSSCGRRTTAANRKNARPSIRNASPTDATFWMIGSGIGMTSANGPRWSRKLASSGGGRM